MHKSNARRLVLEAYRQMLADFTAYVGPSSLGDRIQILAAAKMAARAHGYSV